VLKQHRFKVFMAI